MKDIIYYLNLIKQGFDLSGKNSRSFKGDPVTAPDVRDLHDAAIMEGGDDSLVLETSVE